MSSTKGTPSSMPPSSSPSPITNLFSLPNELLLQIISHTTYPSLYALRRTHSRFDFLITRSVMRDHLLEAEKTSESYFADRGLYICFECLRTLPASRFSDKSRKSPKGRGGVQAHKRFCIRCGLRDRRYQPGQAVVIKGVPGVICVVCEKVFRGGPRSGSDVQWVAENGFCVGHDERGDGAGSEVEANKEALESLVNGQTRKRARKMVCLGRPGYRIESDSDDGSLSDSEFTSEYLYEAWGYDPEC